MSIRSLVKRSPHVELRFNRHYHVLAYTALIGLGWHFLLIGFFAIIGAYPLAALNILSCALWFATFRLNYFGRLQWVLAIIALEMFGHAVFAVYYLGVEAGFQHYILAVIPIVFFNVTFRVSMLLEFIALIYISYLGLSWLGHSNDYRYLYPGVLPVLNLVNILFTVQVFILCSLHFRNSAHIAEKKLTKLAETDPLTRLKNRRSIAPHLEKLASTNAAKPAARLYVLADIDHFKQVNDQYGHQAGDVVLFDVARMLKNRLRESDIVARWGGEEFLLIFEGLTGENAERVVNGIRELIADTPICTKNHEIRITMSFGVACTKEGESHEQAVARADAALYKAKHTGRNRVVVSETSNE